MTAIVSRTKFLSILQDSLLQLITKRIGVETFVDKLAEVSKNEVYSKALKHPQIRLTGASDIQFDHEFCLLYKGNLTNFFFKINI